MDQRARDHILHGRAPEEGHLWLDEASPFPTDHRLVVWDARDAQGPELDPQCAYAPGISRYGTRESQAATIRPLMRPAGRSGRGKRVWRTCTTFSWPPPYGRYKGPTAPPVSSGGSPGSWTRSIVISRHMLSGAHDGGSHWTPSKSV